MGALGAMGAMGALGAIGAGCDECGVRRVRSQVPQLRKYIPLQKFHPLETTCGFQLDLGGHRFLLLSVPMSRHFSELRCWQLARSLRNEVTKILKKPVFDRNHRSRDNLADAASSVRRNIAEGFGRRGHKEFARFLNISLSSLKEVEDGLIECVDNEWATQER